MASQESVAYRAGVTDREKWRLFFALIVVSIFVAGAYLALEAFVKATLTQH